MGHLIAEVSHEIDCLIQHLNSRFDQSQRTEDIKERVLLKTTWIEERDRSVQHLQHMVDGLHLCLLHEDPCIVDTQPSYSATSAVTTSSSSPPIRASSQPTWQKHTQHTQHTQHTATEETEETEETDSPEVYKELIERLQWRLYEETLRSMQTGSVRESDSSKKKITSWSSATW
jgi:hypothetical protein